MRDATEQTDAEAVEKWRKRLHTYLDWLFLKDTSAGAAFHGLQVSLTSTDKDSMSLRPWLTHSACKSAVLKLSSCVFWKEPSRPLVTQGSYKCKAADSTTLGQALTGTVDILWRLHPRGCNAVTGGVVLGLRAQPPDGLPHQQPELRPGSGPRAVQAQGPGARAGELPSPFSAGSPSSASKCAHSTPIDPVWEAMHQRRVCRRCLCWAAWATPARRCTSSSGAWLTFPRRASVQSPTLLRVRRCAALRGVR